MVHLLEMVVFQTYVGPEGGWWAVISPPPPLLTTQISTYKNNGVRKTYPLANIQETMGNHHFIAG